MNATLKSALFTATALLIGSSAFASNMGFKLVMPLKKTTGGTNAGYNWVSLPFFSNYTTSLNAFNDITPTAQVLEVDLYDRATDSIFVQDGFSADFPIPKGAAVRVIVTTDMNWTIVGSHDNAYAVVISPSTGGTNGGINWISVPYHTNKTGALALCTEINGAACGTGRVLEVDRYDRATDSYFVQDGFSTDFPVTIGEGMLVKVSPGAPLNWTPAHY